MSKRTRFVDEHGNPKYTNRLLNDSSPYLVQHAHNPVDWYPWGDEAFAKAAAEDKPIFLSIGYSTCHWCHVMEGESFDNEEIAALLNESFVSIKLDREQRPDLDELYMTGVQMMTGQGGWPMSNFLTAKAEPFFAGTYFPPEQFTNLLEQISLAWRDQRDEVLAQATQISNGIRQRLAVAEQAASISESTVQNAIEQLLASFDEQYAGFGRAPKFPNESQLYLLSQSLEYQTDNRVQQVLLESLIKMSLGGLFDQLGGGFHRYSVDEKWLVPHFEKMLYNQSQLLRLYAAGAAAETDFERILDQTITYLKREMVDADGGFYSASDADSEGAEGTYFVWTHKELKQILSDREFELMVGLLGVTEHGNFEGGTNVLHLTASLKDHAKNQGVTVSDLQTELTDLQNKLLTHREKRPRPFLDKKVIASWNGLMITSLTQVALLTERIDCLDLAKKAANVLWQKHYVEDCSVLMRSRLEDRVSIPGNLEDYAYVAESFLHLYLMTDEVFWLERTEQLIAAMLDRFWDKAGGGFYSSLESDSGPLLVRIKTANDTAMPAANAVALSVLRLAFEATGKQEYQTYSQTLIATFAGQIATSPSAYPYFLGVVQRIWFGSRDRVQWAGGGQVRVALSKNADGKGTLSIRINDHWHINHPDAVALGLIGLDIRGASFSLPEPEMMHTEFQTEPVPVLGGKISVPLEGVGKQIQITLQVCSDQLCLAREELILSLGATSK